MKQIYLTILALALTVQPGFAQKKKKGEDNEPRRLAKVVSLHSVPQVDSGCFMYALPRTVFRVKMVVVREQFTAGPYAAYANKYLGITDAKVSSLSQSKISNISVVSLSEADPKQLYMVQPLESNVYFDFLRMGQEGLMLSPAGYAGASMDAHMGAGGEWGHVAFYNMGIDGTMKEQKAAKKVTVQPVPADTIDIDGAEMDEPQPVVEQKVTLSAKTQDERAQEAARFLSQLRKRRFELATGEIDAVFNSNEGLKVALEEIRSIEQQYMALFVGKTTHQTSTCYFDIIPSGVMNMYPVCKFSEDGGIQHADGSGRNIMLELHVEDKYTGVKSAAARDDFMFKYRIPEVANMRILDGKDELYRGRFYVYQFGKVVSLSAEVFAK
ncbi:MAG: DUF4831 family protein [Prevotellaceae bacterium]|jgi:hypothetical protein|nr:DUF4831 family protein [Prevotellaceae bacterium]